IKAAVEGRLGIRVLLTREDDRDVSLDDRTSLANNNKADLFISLHADASFRPTTSGATVYTAAFEDLSASASAPPPVVPRVATCAGPPREIEPVAWDRATTRHADQSAAFAGILMQLFQDRVPIGARPITRAPLAILESANMPAALVNMGFLSNADQAKL